MISAVSHEETEVSFQRENLDTEHLRDTQTGWEYTVIKLLVNNSQSFTLQRMHINTNMWLIQWCDRLWFIHWIKNAFKMQFKNSFLQYNFAAK